MTIVHIPYCGAAPVPGTAAWNFDPVLLALLLAGAGVHLSWAYDGGRRRSAAAAAGWLVLALLLVSPLCNLSVALFSARVTQHMLLTLAAAPLIAWSLTGLFRGWSPEPIRPTLAFAFALWFWHLPRPYDAAFANDAVYWSMDLSLFGSALWLWASLVRPVAQPGILLAAGLFTSLQMSLLGALLTFAPHPLFAVHVATTQPWGLSPLEDQQIGGAVMWLPGGFLFAAVLVVTLARLIGRPVESSLAPDGRR